MANSMRGRARKPSGCIEHTEGAAGEMAVAKFLGVYWRAKIDTYRSEPDIDDDIEVKTRIWTETHPLDLIVRPHDSPEFRFVHVVSLAHERRYQIRGWMLGSEAMKYPLEVYGGGDPAHFVGSEKMRPMSEFKAPGVARWVLDRPASVDVPEF